MCSVKPFTKFMYETWICNVMYIYILTAIGLWVVKALMWMVEGYGILVHILFYRGL